MATCNVIFRKEIKAQRTKEKKRKELVEDFKEKLRSLYSSRQRLYRRRHLPRRLAVISLMACEHAVANASTDPNENTGIFLFKSLTMTTMKKQTRILHSQPWRDRCTHHSDN